MRYRKTLLGVLLCFLLTGCVSSKYVGRRQYLFDIPKSSTKKAILPCVIFDRVEGVSPFDRVNFLYRVSQTRYLIDYYNIFLTPPAEQLDSILKVRYGALDSGSSRGKNRAQVKLTELYADYRNSRDPRGIIALQFILTKTNDDGKEKVLLDKVFRTSVPLCVKDTNSLIKAWSKGLYYLINSGLTRMFHELSGLSVLKNKVSCRG